MSRKRIYRIMEIQEKRLEMERQAREKQMKEAEAKAKAAQNHHRGAAQRIPI